MKALIVDPAASTAETLGELLRERGWDVAILPGKREAIAALHHGPSGNDLVLADVKSPDYEGLELARALGAHPPTRNLPVVALSAAGDPEIADRSHSAGAAAFLAKPVTGPRLRTVLDQLFPQRPVYFKDLALVRSQIGVDDATVLELARDFLAQLQTLHQQLGSAPASVSPAAFAGLRDGALMLGTDQFVDILHRVAAANSLPDNLATTVGLLADQLLARLPASQPAAGRSQHQPEAAAEETPADRLRRLLASARPTSVVESENLRAELLAAAQGGDHDRQFILGVALLRGDGFTPDRKQALHWLSQAAAHRHPLALCTLGLLKLESARDNLGQDWLQAYQLLSASAKVGCRDADYWVRLMHKGYGEKEPLAASLFHRAANGEAGAQVQLGLLYDRGSEVTANPTEAVYWLTKAAEQGNAAAQHRLGVIFQNGRAGKDNRAFALGWFEQAAQQGHLEAQVAAAHAYESGSLTEADPRQALVWYRRAAAAGDPGAELALGRLLLSLRDDDETRLEAAGWIARAARRGHPAAARRWEELRPQLNPYQLGRVAMFLEAGAPSVKPAGGTAG